MLFRPFFPLVFAAKRLTRKPRGLVNNVAPTATETRDLKTHRLSGSPTVGDLRLPPQARPKTDATCVGLPRTCLQNRQGWWFGGSFPYAAVRESAIPDVVFFERLRRPHPARRRPPKRKRPSASPGHLGGHTTISRRDARGRGKRRSHTAVSRKRTVFFVHSTRDMECFSRYTGTIWFFFCLDGCRWRVLFVFRVGDFNVLKMEHHYVCFRIILWKTYPKTFAIRTLQHNGPA